MHAAQGILTATGGMTSHAAVVARGMGTPCVAGCKEVVISGAGASIDGFPVAEGQWLTIDGGTGEVFDGETAADHAQGDRRSGHLPAMDPTGSATAPRGRGLEGFGIRTNADLPRDAQVAREFGGRGHRPVPHRAHVLRRGQAGDLPGDDRWRKTSIPGGRYWTGCWPLQREDFAGIFKAMDGFPVTVRLLDPPLHEFVPKTEADAEALAEASGVPLDRLKGQDRVVARDEPDARPPGAAGSASPTPKSTTCRCAPSWRRRARWRPAAPACCRRS